MLPKIKLQANKNVPHLWERLGSGVLRCYKATEPTALRKKS